MTRARRAASRLGCLAAVLGALAYLHDPPWIGSVTSGLRPWSRDQDGVSFRWTSGHAAFYVPSAATSMTLRMRPGLPRPDGRQVTVSISIDDRWLATKRLEIPQRWVAVSLPISGETARRFRRVEVRVDGVIPKSNLGVQLAEVQLGERGVER